MDWWWVPAVFKEGTMDEGRWFTTRCGMADVNGGPCNRPAVAWDEQRTALVCFTLRPPHPPGVRIVSPTGTLDELTGLCLSRIFEDALLDCLAQAHLSQHSCTVAVLDIDSLARVTYEHGHAVSGDVLQRVAHLLLCTLPAGSAVFRIGGDEFGIIPRRTDRIRGAIIAEDLCARVAACVITTQDTGVQVTCSIGAATYPDDLAVQTATYPGASATRAAEEADEPQVQRTRLWHLCQIALHAAKQTGGNAVRVAHRIDRR
jgi:diguanylate cyclase (GGDEF)-like protein